MGKFLFLLLSVNFSHADQIVELTAGVPLDLKMSSAAVEVDTGDRAQIKAEWSRKERILRVTAKAPGTYALTVKRPSDGLVLKQYIFNAVSPRLKVIQAEIRASLREIEGIETEIRGGRVVIDGQVLTPAEVARVHTVAKMYGDLARNLVTIRPDAESRIAEKIERQINNPEIRVKIVNGHIMLEGYANSPGERVRAEIIAGSYAQDVVVDEAVADQKIKKMHPN